MAANKKRFQLRVGTDDYMRVQNSSDVIEELFEEFNEQLEYISRGRSYSTCIWDTLTMNVAFYDGKYLYSVKDTGLKFDLRV